MDSDVVREGLAVAAGRLATRGLVIGTGGNLSARDGDRVYTTPSGADLAELTADQVVVTDLDGNVLEDTEYRPTSELLLHLEIYRSTNARAVVHAHPIASIAAANLVDELPAVHYTAALLGGAVRVAPHEIFGTQALTGAVAGALTERTAALMRNHGSVAYGESLGIACERIELVDWLAEIYLRTAAVGTAATLTQKQLIQVAVAAAERGYSPLRRK
ncbi:class II aldolase/adducin family protein [Gordonia rubripertincta]|uniref:Class II aldolase/adducin family protein n=1 Tax=Gordonia rubripertincta TaxID=36822 RepID=A0ABT4N2M3_GORRU|nr:class II aldolase/adducin family protein [Gordonia rubripertincta]MCZ4553506.1 class II aldolase/adducin family protein [Gordonia rubripertincta]